jgi:DNA-binding HxlR family transcriptional regulator
MSRPIQSTSANPELVGERTHGTIVRPESLANAKPESRKGRAARFGGGKNIVTASGHGPDGRACVRRAALACEILLQGKWRIQILFAMSAGPVRLGQLARLIPNASRKMLAHNLRSLEAAGVAVRRDYSDILLHVEYELEPKLREPIRLLLNELSRCGDFYSNDLIREQDLSKDRPSGTVVCIEGEQTPTEPGIVANSADTES